MLKKGGLDGMKLAIFSQAFNGGDLILLVHDGESETGVDATTIDENSTGSALPVIASFFGAEESEILAQGVEQGDARLDLQMVELAVDGQSDRYGARGGVSAGCRHLLGCGCYHVSGKEYGDSGGETSSGEIAEERAPADRRGGYGTIGSIGSVLLGKLFWRMFRTIGHVALRG